MREANHSRPSGAEVWMSGATLPVYLHDVGMENNEESLMEAGDGVGH